MTDDCVLKAYSPANSTGSPQGMTDEDENRYYEDTQAETTAIWPTFKKVLHSRSLKQKFCQDSF